MKKTQVIIIISILALFLMSFLYFNNIKSSSASDVIAIRVIPNHKHYSAMRWYQEQGFTGSPQSMIIDGYEAIRDGRTVYVNVANISGGENPILYTNIYLMSYNQGADSDTIAIVNQMLKHWHFNTNLINSGNCVSADGNITSQCLVDSDCEAGEYCNSAKARVTRDTRRLADLTEIKIALEEYKDQHNHYPILSSGSYIQYNTISTWPSWNNVLAKELNITLPSDPINRLGDCKDDRFEPSTCWDEQAKEFADSDISDAFLNLPAGSNAYVYSSTNNSASYVMCGVMEADYITTLDEGACAGSGTGGGGGSGGQSGQYAEEIENHAPVFIGDELTGYSGKEYKGFVSASDLDGDSLNWNLDTAATLWTMWSAAPILVNTPIENQKAIIADIAGIAGNYQFTIDVNDNRGGVAVQNYVIIVENSSLPIIQPIQDKTITVGNNLSLNILAVEEDNQYPLTFTFTGLPANFPSSFTDVANNSNKHDYYLDNLVEGNIGDYHIIVIAADIYQGVSAPVNFNVAVVNQSPIINTPLGCDEVVKINEDYNSCAITAIDPDGHSIDLFSFAGLPPGLSGDAYNGVISGTPTTVGNYVVAVTATDEYGAVSSSESYNLEVNLEIIIVDNVGDPGWNLGDNNNTVSYNDWLEVAPITTPYIWVASSGSDSVYRIDTATNAVIGPFAVGDNPSRTAVAINGDVWVGNRGSANVTNLDTNGNFIKTCAVGSGPRAVAIDAAGNVWVGNYSNGNVYKLDYDTCEILENVNIGGAPYGAAVDGLNNLWISNRGANRVDKIDIETLAVSQTNLGTDPYGIAIDKYNNVWVAGWGGKRVFKINQAGNIIVDINLGMNCRAMAVDKDNNVWVTHSLNDKVTKLDNNGNVIFTVCTDATMDCNTTVGAHPIGVTATADGHIWVVNYTTHRASKIDPDTGDIVASVNVGLQPYTYSDMAGYMLRAVTLAGGNWTYNVDGTIENPSWGILSWTEVEPGDSYARVRIRSAGNQADLNSAAWSDYFDASPVDLSAVAGIDKRWLQIQVDLHLSIDDASPAIDDLLVTCYP